MADGLDDRALDELHRFAKLDEPNVVPIVLLSSPSFLDRLESDELQFLDGAIIGRLALQRLEPQEVAAFIHFQLNTIAAEDGVSLPADTIAAIAAASQGDPGAVNRLARTALAGRRAARARPAARPARLANGDAGREAPAIIVAPDVPREAAKPAPAPAPAAPPEPLRLSAPTILALPSVDEDEEEAEDLDEEEAEAASPRRPFFEPLLRPLLRLAPVGYVLVAFVSGIAVLSFLAVNHFRPEKAQAIVEASLPPLTKVPLTVAPNAAASKPAAATVVAPPAAPARIAAAEAASPPPVPPAPTAAADAPPPRAMPATPARALAAAPSTPTPDPAPSLPPAAVAAEPAAPVPDARVAAAEASLSPSAAPPDLPAVSAAPALPPDPPKAPPPAVAMVEPTVPQPSLPPAVDAQPTADFTMLVRRGDQLLATGDIASARRFYERAAESGDALALCGLGKSYDPLFLRQLATRGVPPDAAKAATWYRKAAGAGSIEASVRLEQLLASYPQ
jgi:TPR repeat protein